MFDYNLICFILKNNYNLMLNPKNVLILEGSLANC